MKKVKYTVLVMATTQLTFTVEVDTERSYDDYDPDVEAEEAALREYSKWYGDADKIEVIALTQEN
jgi:hypothetical protein